MNSSAVTSSQRESPLGLSLSQQGETNLWLSEIHKLMLVVNRSKRSGPMLQLILFYCVETFWWVFAKDYIGPTLGYLPGHLSTFIGLSLVYSLVLYVLICIRIFTRFYLMSLSRSYRQCFVFMSLNSLALELVALLLVPAEYLINTLKFVLIVYLSTNPQVGSALKNEVISQTGILALLWVDWAVYQMVVFVKLHFLRPLTISDKSLMACFPTKLETMIILCMPFRIGVTTFRAIFESRQLVAPFVFCELAYALLVYLMGFSTRKANHFHNDIITKMFLTFGGIQLIGALSRIILGLKTFQEFCQVWLLSLPFILICALYPLDKITIRTALSMSLSVEEEAMLIISIENSLHKDIKKLSLFNQRQEEEFNFKKRSVIFKNIQTKESLNEKSEKAAPSQQGFKSAALSINTHAKKGSQSNFEKVGSYNQNSLMVAGPAIPAGGASSVANSEISPKDADFRSSKVQVQQQATTRDLFAQAIGVHKRVSQHEQYKEAVWRYLQNLEQKSPKNIFIQFQQIQWLLLHHCSLNLILVALGKLTSRATNFWGKYLVYYIRQEIEVLFRQHYFTEHSFSRVGNGHNDSSGSKSSTDSAAEFIIPGGRNPRKIVSHVKFSSLDLAHVFYYKSKTELLVSAIKKFAEDNNYFLDLIQNKKTDEARLIRVVENQHSRDLKIRDYFEDFDDLILYCEYIDFVPYVYHLNFNTNRYESAHRQMKLMAKRVSLMQQSPHFKLGVIMNDNLFTDTFFLLVDTTPKGLGRILDLYGSYHLFLESYSEAVGQQIDMFFTPTILAHHSEVLNKLYTESIDKYCFIGSNFEGFIKIPGKNFVALSKSTVNIVPFASGNFSYVVGIKPILTGRVDGYYMLLTPDLVVEAYSFNFLDLVSEEFLISGVSLRQISSNTFHQVAAIRDGQLSMKKEPTDFHSLTNRRIYRNFHTSIQAFTPTCAELSIDKAKDHVVEYENLKLEDAFRFTDINGKDSKTKRFQVQIRYKDYLLSSEGYWYLFLIPKEEPQSSILFEEMTLKTEPITDVKIESVKQNTYSVKSPEIIKPELPPLFDYIDADPGELTEDGNAETKRDIRESKALKGMKNLRLNPATPRGQATDPEVQVNSSDTKQAISSNNSEAYKIAVQQPAQPVPQPSRLSEFREAKKLSAIKLRTPENQEIASIEDHIKLVTVSGVTDGPPHDSSSINHEEGLESIKYNKRPPEFSVSRTSRSARGIDAKKRRTLVHQAQMSNRKLDTIREEGNFMNLSEKHVSIMDKSEGPKTPTTEHQLSQNTTQVLTRQKKTKLNKTLTSYERALERKFLSRSLIASIFFSIIGTVICLILLLLAQKELSTKVLFFSHMSALYESHEIFKSEMHLAYLQILKATAYNRGIYSEDRLRRMYYAAGSPSDKSMILSYKSYQEFKLFDTLVRLTKSAGENLHETENGAYLVEYLFNTSFPMETFQEPDKESFFNLTHFEAIQMRTFSSMCRMMTKPVSFFDKYDDDGFEESNDLYMVMDNYLYPFNATMSNLESFLKNIYLNYVINYFFSVMIYSGVSIIGPLIALSVYLWTWIGTSRKLGEIIHSVFLCQDDEILEKRILLNRVTNMCQNYQAANYFFTETLRPQNLDAHSKEEKGFVKIKIGHKKKMSCVGLVHHFSSFMLTAMLIGVFTVVNTVQYSRDNRSLSNFSRRLIALSDTLTFLTTGTMYCLDFYVFERGESDKVLSFVEESKAVFRGNEVYSDLTLFGIESIDKFFSDLLNQNGCTLFHDLNEYSAFCSNIDHGVVSQGYTQTVVRVTSMIRNMASLIMDSNGNPTSQSVLSAFINSEEFVEFEFFVENIYSRYFLDLINKVNSRVKEFTENELLIKNIIWLKVISSIFCLHVVFFSLGVYNLQKLMKKRRYIYHLVPVRSVLENQNIKKTFMETLRLNRLYFG